ncbi:zinc finger, CCHC-type containing protein [Tanacetum coccineum]
MFKYLRGTMNYGLSYVGYPSVLEAYSDDSWINHVEDSSSMSGWVFLLGRGAISWASKKQTCITSSTMESEFVALVAVGKEAEWLRNLIHEILIWPKPIAPISIRCDCAPIMARAYCQIYNRKSRHLGVRHSMVQELKGPPIGHHDTQNCMENPEQGFVEYASSRTDEAGDDWFPIWASQDARVCPGLKLISNGSKTNHIFGLADETKSYPIGIIKDVEVHIGKLKLLNDFYVLDMKKDPENPLLVGRGFLATANAVIDYRMAKIAAGEGITRSVFGVKGIDLGEEEAPY